MEKCLGHNLGDRAVGRLCEHTPRDSLRNLKRLHMAFAGKTSAAGAEVSFIAPKCSRGEGQAIKAHPQNQQKGLLSICEFIVV